MQEILSTVNVTVIIASVLCTNSAVTLCCVTTEFKNTLTEVISENSLIIVMEKIYGDTAI